MRDLLDWIDDRSGIRQALRRYLEAPVPGGARWYKVWPCTILFVFCVQAITGFFVWTFYSPSAQTAWESVYFLQYEVAGGWLLRALHHYSAHVLLVLIGVYVVQTIVMARYRAPREFVFWAAVLMGLAALGLMLTGDLLAWDQNSFASTQVRVSFLTLIPGIGGDLFKLAAGGPEFGHLSLTRFVALHVGLFAAGMLGLVILHGLLLRRADAAEAAAKGGNGAASFWPDQALLNAAANLVVLVVIFLLSIQHGLSGDEAGVALGSPADTNPANFYSAARPEWAFRGLYEFSNLFPGELKIVPIFLVPGLLLTVVLLMPVVGRRRVGHCFNVTFCLVVLGGTAVLSVLSMAHDRDNPEHQAALAAEREQAARVRQLARGPDEVPATGALTLLRNDPKTQGPRLFKAHCAACHDHVRTIEVTLTASHGTLTLKDPKRLNFVSGDGAADAKMRFIGGTAAVNMALEEITFAPDSEYTGVAHVEVAVRGANYPGLRQPLADRVQITVGEVGSGPEQNSAAADSKRSPSPVVIELGSRTQFTDKNTSLVFSPDSDNAIALSDPNASRSDIYAEELSAPNLFRFAHRDWLAGLLDPKQIGGPNYFGNTKLKKMANFVGDSLSDLVEEERQDIRKIVKVLSAEARLRSQTDQDAEDAEQIAEGRNPLITDYGCPDCHKFQDQGALGDAPDLTGYGSRRWLMDIIANPAQNRFYGKSNDRMPVYAESSDEPTKNLLSDRDVALLTDWLRGEWYEPR